MLIKRYKIIVTDEQLRNHLQGTSQPITWSIVANNMPSAWAKFCRQHFGLLLPNPADYDISLEREQNVST